MAGDVGNTEIGPGFHHNGLWRHTAGPEYRDFSLLNRYRISEIGFSEVFYSNRQGITDMKGCAVHRGIARRDLNGLGHLVRGNGPHRNDQRPMKDSSGFAGNRADEHRDILIFFDMADRNICPKQGFFKRKTAT